MAKSCDIPELDSSSSLAKSTSLSSGQLQQSETSTPQPVENGDSFLDRSSSPSESTPPESSKEERPTLETLQKLARIADGVAENPLERQAQEAVRALLRGYVRSLLLPPGRR